MTHLNVAIGLAIYLVGYFGTLTGAYFYTEEKGRTFKAKQEFFKICIIWPVVIAAMLADYWERANFEIPDWIFRIGRFLYLTWPVYPMLLVVGLIFWGACIP